MTDGFREIRGTLGRARRLPSMRRANRATCGFIGLVRVSRGSRLALEAPEVRFVVIGFSHAADT